MMTINQVPPDVAIDLANEFINYFGRFETIEDYISITKEDQFNGKINWLFYLIIQKDEFFNGDIHPEEMEFDIKFVGDILLTILQM